jgi:hypothetical protein
LKIKNRLKDDLTAINVAGAALMNILPEDDFYGGTCLFCGLKEAARVREFFFICILEFNFYNLTIYYKIIAHFSNFWRAFLVIENGFLGAGRRQRPRFGGAADGGARRGRTSRHSSVRAAKRPAQI